MLSRTTFNFLFIPFHDFHYVESNEKRFCFDVEKVARKANLQTAEDFLLSHSFKRTTLLCIWYTVCFVTNDE